MYKGFACLLLLFALLHQAKASHPYTLSILEDKDTRYILGDIISPSLQAQFQKTEDHAYGYGIVETTFWVKLEVDKRDSLSEDVYLVLENQLLDSVTVFVKEEGLYKKLGWAGARIHHSNWQINANYPTFLLSSEETLSPIYLKVQVSTLSNLPVRLLPPQKYFASEGMHTTLMGAFFGILVLFSLYNLLIYYRFRARIFLFYIPFILLIFMMSIIFSGYAYRFVWPESPGFNYIAPELFVAIITSLAAYLSAFVLRVHTLFPRLKPLFRFMGIFPLFLFLLSFFLKKPITVFLFNSIPQSILLFVVCLSYFSWKKGNRAALYFFIGWLSFFIGALIFISKDFGLVPHNFLTEHAILASILVDILMFSLAMGEIVSRTFSKKQKSSFQLKELELELEQLRTQIEAKSENDLAVTQERINKYLKVPLSKREMEVLRLLIEGKRNKDMSELLFISENTIKKHIASIYKKLGVKNRAQLSTKAFTLSQR